MKKQNHSMVYLSVILFICICSFLIVFHIYSIDAGTSSISSNRYSSEEHHNAIFEPAIVTLYHVYNDRVLGFCSNDVSCKYVCE